MIRSDPSIPPAATAAAADAPLPKILVVDDMAANRVAMRRLLARSGAELVEASSGNQALSACLEHEFALILLDVQMPDMDGLEVAQFLSDDEQTRDIPIILVTAAASDDLHRLRGYRLGAVDFIAKPVDDVILRAKVDVFLDLYRGRQQLQRVLEMLNERNRALELEIAERKRAEARVRHQATHDVLTGLPNRALFMERAEQALDMARSSGVDCALLYLDVDGFKPVNDLYGHHAGDQLLIEIGRRLLGCVSGGDTVARLGGDEFAVIVQQAAAAGPLMAFAEQLRQNLTQPYTLQLTCERGVAVSVGASIGVALSQTALGAADPLEALIHAADAAMYRAKRGGRNAAVLSTD